INAGDGGHQHPTQTLTDLFTIQESKGKLSDMVIGLCGDLKFGRTVHSLIKAMSIRDNIKFVLISPEELRVPDYIKNILDNKNIEYKEVERLESVMGEVDVLYMTRVQKERFFNEADYIRLKDSYILDEEKLKSAKADLAILHPLPRVTEIANEVDDDPRAWYFRQVKNGMFVRMALIMELLGVEAC
ncbi:MAG: aspartate carbamoyltransferase, partial [Ezakiella massiliensis]